MLSCFFILVSQFSTRKRVPGPFKLSSGSLPSTPRFQSASAPNAGFCLGTMTIGSGNWRSDSLRELLSDLSGSWSWGSLQGVHPINSRPETRHTWHGRNLRPKAPGSTNHWKPELKPEISYPHLLFQHCSPRCQGAHGVEHSLCSGTGLWVSTSAAPADPLRSVLEHLFEHFIRRASHWRGQSLLQSLWPPQSPYDDAKWCKMMLLRSSPYPLKRPSLRPQPSQDSAKASCGVMAPDALGGEPSQLNQENQIFSRHPSDRNRF